MFDFLRLDRELAHARRQLLQQRLHEAGGVSSRRSRRITELRLLVQRHPVQEPGIRVIFDADFDVHQHATAEESGAMSEASLGETETGSKTSKAESLDKAGVNICFLSISSFAEEWRMHLQP